MLQLRDRKIYVHHCCERKVVKYFERQEKSESEEGRSWDPPTYFVS